jgi:hypothetical protein
MSLYECNDKTCVLGVPGQPGYFTGGTTAEQVNALTGKPVESLVEGKDFGEGFCPVCMTKGKKVGEHKSVVGKDPHQALHNKIAKMVADPEEDLTAEEAYTEFLKAVK